jgi:tryptophan halogenase
MSNGQIRKVVIAGGGTAGWAAAALLAQQFADLLDITLVESEQIGTIGVGESTVPPLRTFHHLIGIDEREFMRATAATFKLSISFENWLRPGDRFFHPFGITGRSTFTCPFHHFWLDSLRRGMTSSLGDYCVETAASRVDKFAFAQQPQVNYAYHIDAGLYARYLRTFAERHGLKRVEGKIREVRQNGESGFIEALVLEDGQVIEGDLFVDCTGFRGLLIEQTLKTATRAGTTGCRATGPWPCRSNRSTRPYPTPAPSRTPPAGAGRFPCNTASAAAWSTPALTCRMMKRSPTCGGTSARNPSRSRCYCASPPAAGSKTWNKNVVSAGLASGFVEPLESTSIHLGITAIVRLIQMFPAEGICQSLVDRYNAISRAELEQVRDFIVLHYTPTGATSQCGRPAARWNCRRRSHNASNSFASARHAWQGEDETVPSRFVDACDARTRASRRDSTIPRARLADPDMRRLFDGIRQPFDRLVATMPSHQQFSSSIARPTRVSGRAGETDAAQRAPWHPHREARRRPRGRAAGW